MPTLRQGKMILKNMSLEELKLVYKEFCGVPFQIAFGGEHEGHETIQVRFRAWRKGTRRNDIFTWFHERGIAE